MLQKRFYKTREHIEYKIQERKYVQTQYRMEGQEGIIFGGFLQSQNGLNNHLVFKVIFDKKEENYNDEIQIITQLEKQRRVIKFQERMQYFLDKVCGLFLEKFHDSLSDQSKQNYSAVTPESIFSFVFDLLDGLLKTKVYKIYNLDMQSAIALTRCIIYGLDHIKLNQFDLALINFSKTQKFSKNITKNSSIVQFLNNIRYCSFEQDNLLKVKYYSALKLFFNYPVEMIKQTISNQDVQEEEGEEDKETTQNIKNMAPISKIIKNKQRPRDDSEQLFESTISRKITINQGFQKQQKCCGDNYYKTEQIDSQINEMLFKGISTQTQTIQAISRNKQTQKIINNIQQHTHYSIDSSMEQVTPEKEEVQINNYKIFEEQCEDKPIKTELPYQQISHKSQKTLTETKEILNTTNSQQTQKKHIKEDTNKIYLEIQGSYELGRKQIYKAYLKQKDNKNELETIVFSSLTRIQSWKSHDNQVNITLNFLSSAEDEMLLQRVRQQDFKLCSSSPIYNYYPKMFTTLNNSEISNHGQSYQLTIQKKYMRYQIPKIELQYSQQQQQLQPISIQQLSDNKQRQKSFNTLPQELQQENEINNRKTLIKTFIPEITQVLESTKRSQEITLIPTVDYQTQIPKEVKSMKRNYFEKISQSKLTEHFLKYQELIEQQLKDRNYFISHYLTSGGEGIVFEGYLKQKSRKNEVVVFKVVFPQKKEDFYDEIDIIRLFEKKINVVEYKECLEVLENKIYVIVLEKCVCSLSTELELIKKFSSTKLLQMIFDLLDGLIQFRIYNILHLDIKPGNILISKEGMYLFADFGISSVMKFRSLIAVKGYTQRYASIEQRNYDPYINFSADVFSLGKTFQDIIKVYKSLNKSKKNKLLISALEEIVDTYMVISQRDQRKSCLELHRMIIEKINFKQYKFFFGEYKLKIMKIIDLYQFDSNKDIPYYLQLKIYYLQVLLNIQNSIQNKHHEEIANTHQMIAANFCELGNPEYGIYHAKVALKIREQSQAQHPLLAGLLNSIGCGYMRIGDYANSLKYCEQSLSMRRLLFKGNHVDIAKTLNNIATCYNIFGQFDKSLEYMLESLKMRRLLYQKNHLLIAVVLNSIGIFYCELGDISNATNYLQESFDMTKQLYSGDNPFIAVSYHYLGCNEFVLGKYRNAIIFELKSLEMMRNIYQKDHPGIADSLTTLCYYYSKLEDYHMALIYGLESLVMYKVVFNLCFENNPKVAFSFSCLSKSYCGIGMYKEALKYAYKALRIRKLIFGEQHTLTADSLSDIGQIYYSWNMLNNAVLRQEQSLSVQKMHFKKRNHQKIAQCLFDLGCTYLKQSDVKKALFSFQSSVKIREELFGKDHPDIEKTLVQVTSCRQKLRQIYLSISKY